MSPVSKFLNPEGLASSRGYTQVVTTQGEKTVYVSGQVATDSTGSLVGKDNLLVQTEQVYYNLQTALAAVGATLENVVKTTTYVVNLNAESLAVVRRVRAQFLPRDNPPASTLVGVAALVVDGLLIEIEAIATLD
jgi:2-iminobutanoate/2-iminopropanoate deaminase